MGLVAPHSMWDLPGPGIEPVSPALAGGFLTTVREVPLPGIFRNTYSHPAYVGGRFFTKFCKGSVFPRGEIARGCLLMAVMRKMEVMGSIRAEAATAIRESLSCA